MNLVTLSGSRNYGHDEKNYTAMHHTLQSSLVNRTEALLFEILNSGLDKLVEGTFLAGNSTVGLQHEV